MRTKTKEENLGNPLEDNLSPIRVMGNRSLLNYWELRLTAKTIKTHLYLQYIFYSLT
jgi:hypothetical protein